jgi:hypothetical protein
MNFFIAKKHKLFARPQSATPKVRKAVRTVNPVKEERFCSYFFGEDKECQTFAPVKYKSICKNFLRSHRNSIEQEVVSIFRNSGFDKSPEPEKQVVVQGKGRKFKDLIRNARFSLVRKGALVVQSPLSGSKVMLFKKRRMSPCNQDFKRIAKESVYLRMTPKLKEKRTRKDEDFGNLCKIEVMKNKKLEEIQVNNLH